MLLPSSDAQDNPHNKYHLPKMPIVPMWGSPGVRDKLQTLKYFCLVPTDAAATDQDLRCLIPRP